MKHVEKRIEPATERDVVFAVTCDLCRTHHKGATISGFGGVHWSIESFGVEDTSVSATSGSNYPEGVFTKSREYHICPSCFHDKLEPWLRGHGAEAEVVESSG